MEKEHINPPEPAQEQHAGSNNDTCENKHKASNSLSTIIEQMQVSESTATAARAILDPLEQGKAPSRALVELVVKALNHDEDVRNAEATGYLRGRNETIEAATSSIDNNTAQQPVNFPVYRRRSFWEK